MIGDLRLLLRLFRWWAPWRGRIAAALAVALVVTLANVGLMAVSGRFVTAMAVAGATGVAIDYFTPAAMIRALAILRTGGRWLERVIGHEATFRLIAATRVTLFTRLERIAPAGLEDLRSGDAAARLQRDVDRLELVFLRLVSPLAVALVTTAVVATVLARYDTGFALAFLVAAGLGGLVGPALAARWAGAAAARTAAIDAEIRTRLVDDLEGLSALLVTDAAVARFEALAARHDDLVATEAEVAASSAAAQAGVGLAADLAVVAVLMLGIPVVASARLAGADLTLAGLGALAAFEAFAAVPGALTGLPATLASAKRIFALADLPAVVADPAVPVAAPERFDLALGGVSVMRPGAARPALTEIDLVVAAGERIALIGASGAGKSTLLDLLVRFHDPDGGEIRLGGVALRALSLAALRSRIVLTGQDPHLFSTTIADNLRLARPGASDDDLRAVLVAVGLIERIDALPEGLATAVGTAGAQLSGGEARRLAVARALLSDAAILLFDEPTEGLDPALAARVVDAILDRAGSRTVIVATHLPIARARMDRVVELDAGRLVPSA